MGATKNIGVAQQKQNFQFYYDVVKHRLPEKYDEKERKKRIICIVNFLLLKFISLKKVIYEN